MGFFKKKKAKKDLFEVGDFNLLSQTAVNSNRQFGVGLVYANDFVNTIYPACAACYSIKKEKTYEEKIDYIGRRVKAKHTSILEHSNIIMQVYVPMTEDSDILYDILKANKKAKYALTDITCTHHQNLLEMLSEFRDCCKYLSIDSRVVNKEGYPVLLMTIGGSIRGYRYIYESIKNRTNSLFLAVQHVLSLIIPKEFFIDFINDGLMEPYETLDFDSVKELQNCVMKNKDTSSNNKYIDIIRMDNLKQIAELSGLPITDCFDFVTISTDFKNMSRVITQQLTRHRNAITQESQRYVNYKDHGFNSPSEFKKKYDETTVYHTEIGDYNLQELGNKLMSIYNSLIEQGVEKEDARGYLPQNNQSGNTFITFTLRSLLCFLGLRIDPHAQAEIREYATILAILTEQYAKDLGYDSMQIMAKQWMNDYPFTFMDMNDDLLG